MRRVSDRSVRGGALTTALAASGLIAALVVATPARAAPTCVFDALTATVTVDVGDGETATIARSGDAITLDGVPCDVATVTTVDAIAVNATGIPAAVVLDLAGGPFAPGLTPDADGGDSEIEITIVLPTGSPTVRVLGSAGPDTFVAGAAGINLNAAEAIGDADVLIIGLPVVVVEGSGGDDVLSVAGGSGTGAASTARLDGGTESDTLLGALGGNVLDGGAGTDTVDYAAAVQLVDANLATGVILHTGNQLDQVVGVENVSGSAGDDMIVGDPTNNVLMGGNGADTLLGGDGADTLLGGDGADSLSGNAGNDQIDGQAGSDTVDFTDSPNGVTVVLIGRTASGDGEDTLSDIENATGSSANDQLIGDDAANVLRGGAGDDRIEGADGDDTLDGGTGIDTVDFGLSDLGVTVKLGKGTATGAGNDTLADIENATGTSKADELNGTPGANILNGGGGPDTLNGRDGGDDLTGGDGRDRLFGQKGRDDLTAGRGHDQLNGGKGNKDVCDGGPDPDSFVFCEVIKLG